MGQWQTFVPHLGKIPAQTGSKTYGVCFNFDGTGNFDYMCAVEVSEAAPLPPPLMHLPVTEQNYAVFTHRGPISEIGKTWDAIYSEWPEKSGDTLVQAPQFESYSEDFNPQAGTGIVEIWIPVKTIHKNSNE
jgi:AraC family transcriptional regulator